MRACVCVCVCAFVLSINMPADAGAGCASLMYGFYYNFNNVRFNKTQHINYLSVAHVVIDCASS